LSAGALVLPGIIEIVSDISRILSWSLRRTLCSERKRATIPLAVAEQHDFCTIRLPAEPLKWKFKMWEGENRKQNSGATEYGRKLQGRIRGGSLFVRQ
jgi:hypothetical protein